MVHDASLTRSNALWRSCANGRTRNNRRDETFIGQKEDMPKRRGFAHKHAILSLVESGGAVSSFHIEGTSAAYLVRIIRANFAKEASIMIDEVGQYTRLY